MANRLSAREAAALTAIRARELEAEAQQAELRKRLSLAQSKRRARLWNSQATKMIEAALNGKCSIDHRTRLIGAKRLIESGFSVAYVDMAAFTREQEKKRRKLEDEERLRRDKANKFRPIVTKQIEDFLRLVEANERFAGMTVTRRNVVNAISKKIEEYQAELQFWRADSDKLFHYLFDGKLFLFKPIDSLRPRTQLLQDALHKLGRLDRDLPEQEGWDHDSDPESDWEAVGDEDKDTTEVPNEFKRSLRTDDCRESMEIRATGDFYIIDWNDADFGEAWDFSEIISAHALGWIAADYGQDLLDLIESTIRTAIKSAATSVSLVAALDDECWSCIFDGVDRMDIPRPEHLAQILRAMKYSVRLKSVSQQGATIEISW